MNDLLQETFTAIKTFSPTARGTERELNRQLSRHLTALGLPNDVEAPLPTHGKRADLLVKERIIIEAKLNVSDLIPFSSLQEKLDIYLKLKGFKTILVVYGSVRSDLYKRLKQAFPYPEVAVLNSLKGLPRTGKTATGEEPEDELFEYPATVTLLCPKHFTEPKTCDFEKKGIEVPTFPTKFNAFCPYCGTHLFPLEVCEACGEPLTDIDYSEEHKTATPSYSQTIRKWKIKYKNLEKVKYCEHCSSHVSKEQELVHAWVKRKWHRSLSDVY